MDVVTLAAARHYTNKKIGEMGAGGAMEKLVDLTLTEAAVVTITQTDDGTPLNLGDFDVNLSIPAMTTSTRILIAPSIAVRKGFVGSTNANADCLIRATYRTCEDGYDAVSSTLNTSAWLNGAALYRYVPRGGFETVETCTQICIGATDQFTELPAGTNIKVYGKQVSV